MIDIAIDENGDIGLDAAGDLATVEDTQAVAQMLAIGYRTLRGELFFAPGAGLDYFGAITEKGTRLETIEAIYRNDTIRTQGVARVESLEIGEFEDRRAPVAVTVQTIFGPVTVGREAADAVEV